MPGFRQKKNAKKTETQRKKRQETQRNIDYLPKIYTFERLRKIL
jgi:hypothetical protein